MAAQLKSYSATNGRTHNELLHDRHLIQPIMLGLGGISGDIDKSVMATQEKLICQQNTEGEWTYG